MPSIEQIKASNGSGNANLATVQSSRAPGATTIDVDTVLDINPGGFMATMGTPHTFTDPITSEIITVISEATAVDFVGHIDTSHIVIDTIAPGYTDAGSEVGDIVIIRPTTQYADNIAAVLAAAHNDNGTHKSGAVYLLPTIASFANALHTHANSAGGGQLDFAALLSTIFSGQVQTQANAGSAGGTMWWVNLGGIKILWGYGSAQTIGGAGNTAVAWTLPAFFTTIQGLIPGVESVGNAAYSFINTKSTGSISLFITSAGATTAKSTLLVVGT